MARRSSRIFIVLLTITVMVAAFALRASADKSALALGASAGAPPPSGGSLVSSLRSEPRNFNRFADSRYATDLINLLTQARLVRVNRLTSTLEPMLAESWTTSSDRLTYTLKLRRGVKFSDGVAFTAADVLFSLRAADCLIARCAPDDTDNGSVLRIRVRDKPLVVTAIDDYTVSIRFPSLFGPGLRVLDGLPIYPRHLLEPSLNDGTFAKQWGTTTPPDKMAGLGPFVLKEYVPKQRLVFERNPNYWRRDASGGRLPYLDKITLEIFADQNAEALRVQAGQVDCMSNEIRPEDYPAYKQAAAAGRVRLTDLGVGLDADSFWINLRKDAKIAPERRVWLQDVELRRAINESIDRKRFADVVFFGAAVPIHGPITPANKQWYDPTLSKPGFDRKAAAARLAKLGFTQKNADGLLVNASGQPLRFTLLTLKSKTSLERGAAQIRDDLRAVGIGVDVVPLEQGMLTERLQKGDFEAAYFQFLFLDTDPALNPEFWLSRGSFHVWDSEQQTPATAWEAQIDELMAKQAATVNDTERKQLFGQAQRILAENAPILYFAAPRAIVVTTTRLQNATPTPIRPMVLWSADTLAVQKAKGTN